MNSWAPATQPLIRNASLSEQQVPPNMGVGGGSGSSHETPVMFFFQDIKASENQGPRTVEAGAPGTGFLGLRQRGQLRTEGIPSESRPL